MARLFFPETKDESLTHVVIHKYLEWDSFEHHCNGFTCADDARRHFAEHTEKLRRAVKWNSLEWGCNNSGTLYLCEVVLRRTNQCTPPSSHHPDANYFHLQTFTDYDGEWTLTSMALNKYNQFADLKKAFDTHRQLTTGGDLEQDLGLRVLKELSKNS